MSSDSSMDSEERAESNRLVDEYFPRPAEKPYVTASGYKAITAEEERGLLERGVMTYYRGHLDSQCCEACDDALRTSDRYARQMAELRPVGVQKHKYIDKSRAGCGRFREVSKAPLDLKTGFLVVKDDEMEKQQAEYDSYVHSKKHLDLLDQLKLLIDPLNEASESNHNATDIAKLMSGMKDMNLTDLFFHYSEDIRNNIKNFKLDLSLIIENVRQNLLHPFEFELTGVQYGTIGCLILIMLLEFTRREAVKDQMMSFFNVVTVKYRLNFKKMVQELSKLPVYKEPVRKAAKVRFNHSDSAEHESNEEFKEKRKKIDSCPREVAGTTIQDIYDLPTFEEE